MDPIAAFHKQQERNGINHEPAEHKPVWTRALEKSIPELREANPRWAMLYDRIDTSGDGLLQLIEVTQGFRNIMGAGAEVPEHHLKAVFAEIDTENSDALDFKGFCVLVHKVSNYMMDNPKWRDTEDKLDKEERHKDHEKAKEAKKAKDLDIFAVLGLPRSKELQEMEQRKKQAINRARMASKGAANPEGRPPSGPPSGPTAKRASGLKRGQLSIESTGTATSGVSDGTNSQVPERQWERFSVSSARGQTNRRLTNVRQLHLPDNLPQIRALGKRNAGCFALRFSPDGSQLAGGFFDGGVRVFDVDKASQAHCMNLPKSKGGSIKSAEEVAREDKEEAMGAPQPVDMDAGVDLSEVIKKWEPVTNIRWQPNNDKVSVLASVDTKGQLSLWDVPRNKQSRSASCLGQVDTGGALTSLAWTCEGDSVAVGGADKIIKVYDVQSEQGKCIFNPSTRLGETVAFCGKCTGHALKIVSIASHPTSPSVFVSAGMDRQLLLWDIRAGTVPQAAILGPELAGDAVDISKDGNSILAGSHRSKNPLEIYDLRQSGEEKPTLSYSWLGNEESSEGGGRWTTCLVLTACWDVQDNKTVVAAGENENLARIYERSADDSEPLRIIGTLRGKEQAFWSSAISMDGRNAALGSSDGAVCLVDICRK